MEIEVALCAQMTDIANRPENKNIMIDKAFCSDLRLIRAVGTDEDIK
jgi:hypothetical protein